MQGNLYCSTNSSWKHCYWYSWDETICGVHVNTSLNRSQVNEITPSPTYYMHSFSPSILLYSFRAVRLFVHTVVHQQLNLRSVINCQTAGYSRGYESQTPTLYTYTVHVKPQKRNHIINAYTTFALHTRAVNPTVLPVWWTVWQHLISTLPDIARSMIPTHETSWGQQHYSDEPDTAVCLRRAKSSSTVTWTCKDAMNCMQTTNNR